MENGPPGFGLPGWVDIRGFVGIHPRVSDLISLTLKYKKHPFGYGVCVTLALLCVTGYTVSMERFRRYSARSAVAVYILGDWAYAAWYSWSYWDTAAWYDKGVLVSYAFARALLWPLLVPLEWF